MKTDIEFIERKPSLFVTSVSKANWSLDKEDRLTWSLAVEAMRALRGCDDENQLCGVEIAMASAYSYYLRELARAIENGSLYRFERQIAHECDYILQNNDLPPVLAENLINVLNRIWIFRKRDHALPVASRAISYLRNLHRQSQTQYYDNTYVQNLKAAGYEVFKI